MRRYLNKYINTSLNLLLISDIHFSKNSFIGTYDKTIEYDYFIYAGDLLSLYYYEVVIPMNIFILI